MNLYGTSLESYRGLHRFHIRLVSLNVWQIGRLKFVAILSSSHNVIKSNPIKNAYPPLLINKFIKKQPFKMLQRTLKRKFNIKVISNSFKIKNYFLYKDQIPVDLKYFLVYKFTCSCSSGYISEPCRHFKSRIEEHIKRITSLIF